MVEDVNRKTRLKEEFQLFVAFGSVTYAHVTVSWFLQVLHFLDPNGTTLHHL